MTKNIDIEVRQTINKINKIFIEKYKRDPYLYYTTGHCYYYGKILQSQFEEALLYYSDSHVVTKIGNLYYDALGSLLPKDCTMIEDEEHEAYVRMVLAPTNATPDLLINEYIINELNKEKELKKNDEKKTFRK